MQEDTMMDAETQIMNYSPGPSHSGESSDSEESSGFDVPSNRPTQLMYSTQLLDSYDRYGEEMYDADRTQQLDNMDMDTQLMDDDDSYDFGDRKGVGDDCTMIIPSEDEASKDTQLMTADDGDSGTSSEMDDEVDSELSPSRNSFSDKSSDWPSKMADIGRRGEGSSGLGNDFFRDGGQETESHRDHLKPCHSGALAARSGEGQIGVPQILKDSNFNKSVGSHLVGCSDELVRDRKICNEDQRDWEPSMVVLLPIDPDAYSGRTEEDSRLPRTTGSTYPGEPNSLQNINSGRLSAYSSGNFCQQDLNKSPEPETHQKDDDWGGVNGGHLGTIGRIDEGGSNVGILDRHEAAYPPKSSLQIDRSEGILTAETRSLPKARSNSRTPGSIRTASLRASALRASSCSSSSRHRHTPGVSQNEEVQKVEKDPNDTPTCAASSAGFVTPASRLSSQRGIPSSAVYAASVRSNSQGAGESSGNRDIGILSGNVKEQTAGESSAGKQERTRTSPSVSQSSKSADQSLSRARKLFSGIETEQDDVFSQGKQQEMQKSPSNANEDGNKSEKRESTPPSIIDSQAEKTMERRSSFGSGLFSQSSELSYLNFQSPGEDSQARALNMVDKLVWLNATGLSQEPQLEEERGPSRVNSSAKSALQSRMQVADAKAGNNDPFGVFDWVDSQHDDAGIFFGNKGASALKRASNFSGSIDHPKQAGMGMRRPGVLDASGLRTIKVDKPEIPSKPAANLERPRRPLPNSAVSSKENRNDHLMRLGKLSTPGGPAHNSGEQERVQTASNLDASGWRVANKAFSDSGVPKNFETVMSKLAAGNPRPEVASKIPLQKTDGLNALPKTSGVHGDQFSSKVSEQLFKTSASDKETGIPHSIPVGKPPHRFQEDSRSEALLKTGASDKVEKAETKSSALAHTEQIDKRKLQLDGTSTVSTMSLQNEGSGRGIASVDLTGSIDSRRILSDRVEHGAAEFSDAGDSTEVHCEVDCSNGTSGNISSPGKEEENVGDVPSVRQPSGNMGPETLGAVEAIGMMGTDFPASNGGEGGEASRDNEASDDGKAALLASETDDGIQGRPMVTRRSRSHGRRNAGVETSRSQKENENLKSRTRRVTWAGPLEQAPSTTGRVSKGRIARHQQNPQAEVDPNKPRPVSDLEAEDQVNGGTNEDRKENANFSDGREAKDSDLDKIKKRFNMSDAAVERLLGTDEGTETSHSLGVKTRFLSRIQPEVEEDEVAGAPSIKVGKGLRSSRSRGDEGSISGKRRRACTTPNNEEEKHFDKERTGSPCDTDAAETSVERTPCVEPSDNEAVTGRRRMRSIADVSSLSTSKAVSGRPPQGSVSRRGGRGRRPSRPPVEHKVDHADAEPLPPAAPALSSAPGRPRGKSGPRSVRKCKEVEPLKGGSYITSPTSSGEASTTSSKETPKRTSSETVTVLFSHGLPEDVGKKQRKILGKLGGTATSSAFQCTHFVADKFVRTGNMLEAMAAGKPVVTSAWLESCLQANCFVDEQLYILQDIKKEAEMGFSMASTLMEAQQRPLLQDIRVYITPGTTPGPDALGKIVKAAGGQVVDKYEGPSPDGEKKSDFCLVLSSEEELELCTPLLEQGAKVFTSELLLSGVMCHNLDLSNDQLFQNFTNKRRRASLSRRIF